MLAFNAKDKLQTKRIEKALKDIQQTKKADTNFNQSHLLKSGNSTVLNTRPSTHMRPDDSSVGTGAFEYKEQPQTAPLGEIKKPMSVREAILLAQ